MAQQHLVVAGASLAGLRAVEAARRGGFAGTVTLIGAEPHLPYDRPPLSKDFLTKGAQPRYFRTEESLREDLDVTLRLGTPATELRPDERVIVTGDDEIRYTALVIATGSLARELPGAPALAGVHTLRTVDDAVALRAELTPGSRVVIIGAGFIGSEIARSARGIGAEVTMVEAAPVPLVRAVGEAMGEVCAAVHHRAGTALRCGTGVDGIEGDGSVTAVRLADGSTLPADVVVVGIGARPATDWLTESGLTIADGVVCDTTLNTGVPGVYAAGDVARWVNPLFGESMRLEHWTTAAEQGGLAARNAINPAEAVEYSTVPYFWSDWDTDRIQFVGVPDADEVTIAAGDVDSDSFLALYRRASLVTGALGLNMRRPVMQLRRMIAERASWHDAVEFARAL